MSGSSSRVRRVPSAILLQDPADPSRRLYADPLITDTAEIFQSHPQEAAVVLQRGVELSTFLSTLLVAHCAYLAYEDTSASSLDLEGFDVDSILKVLCMLRVVCTAPRPYFWIWRRSRFVAAKCLPTPQQVSRRLLEISSEPHSLSEDLLQSFFYAWLLVMCLLVFLTRLSPDPTELADAVWHHVLLNVFSMILHRVSCIFLFIRLTHMDLKRGVSNMTLEAQSTRLTYVEGKMDAHLGDFGKDDCSVCLCPYAAGEELRKLHCGHCFHSKCLDPWLLNHKNRCPLCQDVVGEAAI